MKFIIPLASFERCQKKLDPQAKSKLKDALENFHGCPNVFKIVFVND